jgi:hypothetical protein
MVELGMETGTIVTRNEDERIDAGGGTIEVIPAWRYLLDLPQPVESPQGSVIIVVDYRNIGCPLYSQSGNRNWRLV